VGGCHQSAGRATQDAGPRLVPLSSLRTLGLPSVVTCSPAALGSTPVSKMATTCVCVCVCVCACVRVCVWRDMHTRTRARLKHVLCAVTRSLARACASPPARQPATQQRQRSPTHHAAAVKLRMLLQEARCSDLCLRHCSSKQRERVHTAACLVLCCSWCRWGGGPHHSLPLLVPTAAAAALACGRGLLLLAGGAVLLRGGAGAFGWWAQELRRLLPRLGAAAAPDCKWAPGGDSGGDSGGVVVGVVPEQPHPTGKRQQRGLISSCCDFDCLRKGLRSWLCVCEGVWLFCCCVALQMRGRAHTAQVKCVSSRRLSNSCARHAAHCSPAAAGGGGALVLALGFHTLNQQLKRAVCALGTAVREPSLTQAHLGGERRLQPAAGWPHCC
jgi:hypothetical protein